MSDLLRTLRVPHPCAATASSLSPSTSGQEMDVNMTSTSTAAQQHMSIPGLTLLDTEELIRSVTTEMEAEPQITAAHDPLMTMMAMHGDQHTSMDVDVSQSLLNAGGSHTSVGEPITTTMTTRTRGDGPVDFPIDHIMQLRPAGGKPAQSQPPPPSPQPLLLQQSKYEEVQQQVRDPHAVSKLYELCQQHRLPPPEFTFDEVSLQTFTAQLRIGPELFVQDDERKFPSKKAAKEAVAARGLKLAQDYIATMPSTTPPSLQDQQEQGSEFNWVGRLLEFYQSLPPTTLQALPHAGPQWTEHASSSSANYVLNANNQAHACECTLPHRPDRPFGHPRLFFRSKKLAKANAAKEALLWLESSGILNAGGGGGGGAGTKV